MNRFENAFFVAGVLLATCGCDREAAPAGAPHHLILISIDTARADHFGFMGSDFVKTPVLDALAGESVVFTDYMTVAPTTLASHASLFTGNYPHRHGIPRNGFVLHDENEMLAEILRSRGFETAGFSASFALDSRFGIDQGFEHYDEAYDKFTGNRVLYVDQRSATSMTDAVVGYLDERGEADRSFLFVHYFDPHLPYEAPEEFVTLYDDDLSHVPITPLQIRRSHTLTDEERRSAARAHQLRYAAEISYTDREIGRLLDELRRRGMYDSSLIVVTTDHGENLLDHPVHFNHGRTLYDSTMKSICMMRLPNGRDGGTRIDALTASIDVLPTVLHLLGADAPEGIDGERVDLERTTSTKPRVRFGQASQPWEEIETDPRWTNMLKARSIRAGRFKLIHTPYQQLEELYDLGDDPTESRNLLLEPTEDVAALAGELKAELDRWAATANPLSSIFAPRQKKEAIERLKSLGYLGGDGD